MRARPRTRGRQPEEGRDQAARVPAALARITHKETGGILTTVADLAHKREWHRGATTAVVQVAHLLQVRRDA
eukprot:1313333-Lingulodinium_polyedra.AAC.1